MILIGAVLTFIPLVALIAITILGMNTAFIFFTSMTAIGLGNGLCLPNANAGIVSSCDGMAGSAAGLGGALMMGLGAALAALTGVLLQSSNNELPMLIVMSVSALAAMFLAIFKEKISK